MIHVHTCLPILIYFVWNNKKKLSTTSCWCAILFILYHPCLARAVRIEHRPFKKKTTHIHNTHTKRSFMRVHSAHSANRHQKHRTQFQFVPSLFFFLGFALHKRNHFGSGHDFYENFTTINYNATDLLSALNVSNC